MDKKMTKKVIWITGASRGIGASIVKKLAVSDFILALSARTAESFNDIREELSHFQNVYIFPCDVSRAEQVQKVYNKIVSSIGKVGILINNAGVAEFKSFEKFSIDDFNSMINTNLLGTFLTTKAVIPSMIEEKHGVIVNIISVASEKTFKGSSVYSASKAGVLAMSRSMREDLRDKGIKVIDILPGATETNLWSEKSREKYNWRMMQPDNLAEIVFNVIQNSMNDNFMIEEIIVRPQLGDLN